MIATGLTFLFGFFLACLLALLLSPIVWRRSRRMARREFEATIPTSVNEIRASYDHVRAASAIQTRTREMDAAAAVERAAHERANAGRISLENAGLRERNSALITLLSEHKAAFEDVAETLELRESEFDKLEAELRETRRELDLRSEELDALARQFRVLVGRAERGGVDTGFDADDLVDDAVGDRPSRIEMQKTLKAFSAEIETLRTDLRQEQSTVRERDATILDLLAGVANAQAASLQGKDEQERSAGESGATAQAAGMAPDAVSNPASAVETEGEAAEAKDPETSAISDVGSTDLKGPQEHEQRSTTAVEPAPPATARSGDAALAAAKSFSSLFASRIREALKRPQAQDAKSSGPAAGPSIITAASVPVPVPVPVPSPANRPVAELAVADHVAPKTEDESGQKPSNAGLSTEAAARPPIAQRLREALQLPDHPLGSDEVDDETLRQRIVDLAARVIDQAARIEGKASPIETILTADRSFSSLSRPRERQTLTDRVRVMRSEAEAAE